MRPTTALIRLDQVSNATLATTPYRWGIVDDLFEPTVGTELMANYPTTPYQTVAGRDGEKSYEYEARLLVGMGDDKPADAEDLAPSWRMLARELCSPGYRHAMSTLTGYELASVPIEINVFHYGPGAWLGPHVDLADKLVTHVLYFNAAWDPSDGGCLRILRSPRVDDVIAELRPIVGSSSVVVRSDRSYHAVTPISPFARDTRRSVTVTFYRPGSASTMWPADQHLGLHPFSSPTL
jgi:hypothetical protein